MNTIQIPRAIIINKHWPASMALNHMDAADWLHECPFRTMLGCRWRAYYANNLRTLKRNHPLFLERRQAARQRILALVP